MKAKFLILPLAVAALLLAGCKSEKKAPQTFAPGEPQMELSSNDTTTVRQLTNEFLELVKEGRIDEAVGSLYVLENDDVRPMPEDEREACAMSLGAFDVKGYAIKRLIFFKETDSEVEYALYLDDPALKRNPRTFNGLIRPVRRDGAWYITLANGYQHSEIVK